jgi:hypothetical protein
VSSVEVDKYNNRGQYHRYIKLITKKDNKNLFYPLCYLLPTTGNTNKNYYAKHRPNFIRLFTNFIIYRIIKLHFRDQIIYLLNLANCELLLTLSELIT